MLKRRNVNALDLVRKKGKHGHKNESDVPMAWWSGFLGQNLSSVLRTCASLGRFLHNSLTVKYVVVLLCFNVFVDAIFIAPRTMADT